MKEKPNHCTLCSTRNNALIMLSLVEGAEFFHREIHTKHRKNNVTYFTNGVFLPWHMVRIFIFKSRLPSVAGHYTGAG